MEQGHHDVSALPGGAPAAGGPAGAAGAGGEGTVGGQAVLLEGPGADSHLYVDVVGEFVGAAAAAAARCSGKLCVIAESCRCVVDRGTGAHAPLLQELFWPLSPVLRPPLQRRISTHLRPPT